MRNTEAAGLFIESVGERSVVGRRCAVRHAGRIRSDYAGTSSDKTGEKPVHRKPKVS